MNSSSRNLSIPINFRISLGRHSCKNFKAKEIAEAISQHSWWWAQRAGSLQRSPGRTPTSQVRRRGQQSAEFPHGPGAGGQGAEPTLFLLALFRVVWASISETLACFPIFLKLLAIWKRVLREHQCYRKSGNFTSVWKGSVHLLVTVTNRCNWFKNKYLHFNSPPIEQQWRKIQLRDQKAQTLPKCLGTFRSQDGEAIGVSIKSVWSPVGTGTKAPVSTGTENRHAPPQHTELSFLSFWASFPS